MPLFDESTLRKLDQLMLVASRVRAGVMKGDRRSTKRGTSIEFADYRNYVRGDDLRRIDWNVFARLEKPFIKLLEEEEDLAVHVLLDVSQSMSWAAQAGDDSAGKYTYARQLAAALGYIALAAGDRLTLAPLAGSDLAGQPFGPVRGRGHTMRLLAWLEGLPSGGETDLDAALTSYARRARRPGLCLVITDLFSPSGYQGGITALQGRGYEVAVLHLMTPDELDPQLAGDLRLLDSETGTPQDVSLDGGLRRLYRERVQAWRDEQAAWCQRRDVHFVPVNTDVPWTQLVLSQLRARRLVA